MTQLFSEEDIGHRGSLLCCQNLSELFSHSTVAMFSLQSYLLFVCSFFFFIHTDGQFLTIQNLCYFRGEDPLDVEYIYRLYANRVKALEYNSTVNRFTGYTQCGTEEAKKHNQNEDYLHTTKSRVELCTKYGQLMYSGVLVKTVKPYAHLSTEKHHSDRNLIVLKCSAYKFYPRKIKVTWLRDGQKVPLTMTSTEELANGDWYYQIHSYLEITPTPGEEISCVLKHASLTDSMILHWDKPLPWSEKSKMAIGASGLALGGVFASAGFISYCKTQSAARGKPMKGHSMEPMRERERGGAPQARKTADTKGTRYKPLLTQLLTQLTEGVQGR